MASMSLIGHLRRVALIVVAAGLASAAVATSASAQTQAAPGAGAPPASAIGPDGPTTGSAAAEVTIAPRPVAMMKGESTEDDAYTNITGALKKIADVLAKNGIKPAGRPLALFIEIGENDTFKFEAMVPIDKPADGSKPLSPDVTVTELPGGKALKFEHRGAYDDIRSTYDAINAYVDAKGYQINDFIAEEYLNDVDGSDDMHLAVNIYIYIK